MHFIIPKNWTAITSTTTSNNTNVENNNDATNNNATTTTTTKDWKNETYYQAIYMIRNHFPVPSASQLTPNMYIARARCEAISAVGPVGWMLADHGNRLLCSILLVDPRLLSRFVSRHSICWS